MQIRGIGYGLQSSLRGNVVNVENNLNICAKVLPRAFDDTATIQVKLMRKMNYKVYKEIPGLTVSALRELDAAHCDPGVLLPGCHSGKRANKESESLEWRKLHWRERIILVLDVAQSSCVIICSRQCQ